MLPFVLRPLLPLLFLPLITGCGKAPLTAPVAAKAAPAISRAIAAAKVKSPIDGAVTACAVLAHTHTLARILDAKAAFTGMVGTKINPNGVPAKGAEWIVTYAGTEGLPNPANGYVQLYRRITITVSATGTVKVETVETEGMPLGQCYFDAPIPEMDSHEVVGKLRELRPSEPSTGTYRLALAGMLNQAHLAELVWKVTRPTQSAGGSLTLNAMTGDWVTR